MLTYNDEMLWPQNLGAVTIANYTFIKDTNTPKYMSLLDNINFTDDLNKTTNKPCIPMR